MSCKIEAIADCGDIKTIFRALYLNDQHDTNWLNDCVLALSPCGNLLLCGHGSRLAARVSTWVRGTPCPSYLASWSTTASARITALIALPLHAASHSNQDGPDWVCTVAGLSSGDVCFYSEAGHLLTALRARDTPVIRIASAPDGLHVLYADTLCLLSASTLYRSLRLAKAHLAKVQAGACTEQDSEASDLAWQAWQLAAQDVVDAAFVGLELHNTFDHLLSAANRNGYDAWYRSVAPHSTGVVCAGAQPYLALETAPAGGASPPLTHVARALASRIKASLNGWLGGSASGSNVAEASEPAVPLLLRAVLADSGRRARALLLSPCRRLAAVTDVLGRVALFDVRRAHLLRLFKGYRDAQCAFIQVHEEDTKRNHFTSTPTHNTTERRKALFLIIYTPKKGLIDIRLMQRGTVVAVFTAAKNGRLLYNTHSLVGTDPSYLAKKNNAPKIPCALIDPDGTIKKIIIPFHFALDGDSSHKSRDLHLLKTLKHFIRQADFDATELNLTIDNTARELKTTHMKKHLLDLLTSSKSITPPHILTCCRIFLESLNCDDIIDHRSSQLVSLYNYCTCLSNLCKFFMLLHSIKFNEIDTKSSIYEENYHEKDSRENSHEIEDTENKVNQTSNSACVDVLLLTDTELSNLEKLLKLAVGSTYEEESKPKVTFKDFVNSSFEEFLACFNTANPSQMEMKPSILPHQIKVLCRCIFGKIFSTDITYIKRWSCYTKSCKINPIDLAKLLVHHFMEIPLTSIDPGIFTRFQITMYEICLMDIEGVVTSYNESSSWWQSIREMLVEAVCPLRSMAVALICRAIVRHFENKVETNVESEAWESVTKEYAVWSLLIGKLEDISLLSIITLFKHIYIGKSLPQNRIDPIQINLRYIYNRGKGSVSELIAKWLTSIGVHPETIVAHEIQYLGNLVNEPCKNINQDDESQVESETLLEENSHLIEKNQCLFVWLSMLRKQFPYSVESNSLIGNMCWEYAVAWQKQPENMTKFEAILVCLDNIQNVHISNGLFSLIWSTHLQHIFELCCKLINKVGKLPKERLCKQDVGISEDKVSWFLKLCLHFIEKYLHSAIKVEKAIKPVLHFESIWDDSPPALVEVAQESERVNIDSLDLLYQIGAVLYYICELNVKFSKPLNTLFDCDLQIIFDRLWGPNKSISVPGSDGRLHTPRVRFLLRLVSAALELVVCDEPGEDGLRILHSEEMTEWMDRIYSLAQIWSIDSDIVRREQVIRLFTREMDMLVEELLAQVSEPEHILEDLCIEGARRVKRYVEASPDAATALSSLPPQLATYIATMECENAPASIAAVVSAADVLRSVEARGGAAPPPARRLAALILQGANVLQEIHGHC